MGFSELVGEGLIANAFNALSFPWAIVSSDWKLCHCNKAFQAQLLDGKVFEVQEGTLRLNNSKDTENLQEAVRLSFDNETAGQCKSFKLNEHPSLDDVPLIFSVRKLEAHNTHPEHTTFYFLTTNRLKRPQTDDLETLFSHLELTSAEAKIAARIAQGQSVAECASSLHIKPNTVRWHLKQIFHKTNTNRQADLHKLVMQLLPPI